MKKKKKNRGGNSHKMCPKMSTILTKQQFEDFGEQEIQSLIKLSTFS